ncbi:patatin-like phospholipase family protein [Planobispora siamensis]|uniref:PNPLA domain-containing protein n=1 Tax=Planobispora siamensis TaxID=936338 RepID=A0A8J3SH53_9ACTN|nr:patatin-like phospholipase family protein [Planobispora siamensis]GIH94223.1 hypothetical protein Psi01_48530 [Planobispora siamensis]
MSGKLALVLSGGGAPAAYFGAGVIAHLEERGLLDRVQVVSGTSAGAFNAAAVAVGLKAEELARMWRSVRPLDFAGPRLDFGLINWGALLRGPTTGLTDYLLNTIAWTWFAETRQARRWVLDNLGRPNDPKGRIPVREGMTLIVSAVNLSTGRVIRFTNRKPERDRAPAAAERPYSLSYEYLQEELTVDHLFSSAAVPLLFRPGMHGGQEHVDAGLVANTPLSPVFDYRPDAVVVVSASGVSSVLGSPASLGAAISRIADNIARYSVYSSYEHAKTINTLIEQAPQAELAGDKKQVDLRLIEPEGRELTLSGFLGFREKTAEQLIEFGHAQAERALKGWPEEPSRTGRG